MTLPAHGHEVSGFVRDVRPRPDWQDVVHRELAAPGPAQTTGVAVSRHYQCTQGGNVATQRDSTRCDASAPLRIARASLRGPQQGARLAGGWKEKRLNS